MDTLILKQFALSFMLGLLVGIQRERMKVRLGGMRTFPLISVFGTVCAILAQVHGSWVLFSGMISLAMVCVVPHLCHLIFYVVHPTIPPGTLDVPPSKEKRNDDEANEEPSEPVNIDAKDRDFGITTLMAAMLLFAVGALLTVENMMPLAVILGGSIAILLQFKIELHSVLDRLKDSDMRAIMQFVLISCVILPVLPNESFGPYNAFNPFEAWLMVVLIVGMGLGGYIVYMFLGQNAGCFLGGFLGGAISSTATTISYSKQAQVAPTTRSISAVVIMIASTVVFVRVLIEIAIVCPEFVRYCIGPLCVLMALTMIPAIVLWLGVRKAPPPMPEQKNPTQLKSAITFGLLYTLVKFALAVASQHAGDYGLWVVAAFSGLTDMDAITLSTARMMQEQVVAEAPNLGELMSHRWKLILIAAISNLVFKSLIVASIADRKFFISMLKLFAIPFFGGIGILIFWP